MTFNSKFMFVRSYLFLEIFVQFILFTHCLEFDLYPDPVFGRSDKSSPVNADNLGSTILEKSKTPSETRGKNLNETNLQETKANQNLSVERKSLLRNYNQKNISEKQIINDSYLKDKNLLRAYNDEERPVKALALLDPKPDTDNTTDEDDTPDYPEFRVDHKLGSKYYKHRLHENRLDKPYPNHNQSSVLSTTPAPRKKENRGTDPLDNLHRVPDMLGIELKTAVYIVAALGIVHVFFYGCTLFMNLSYMLVTIWVFVVLYSTISLILFVALPGDSTLVLRIWIWYSLCFVVMMCLMMLLVATWFLVRAEYSRLSLVFLGFAWYGLTMYFVLVVNSYRMQLEDEPAFEQISEEKISK